MNRAEDPEGASLGVALFLMLFVMMFSVSVFFSTRRNGQ